MRADTFRKLRYVEKDLEELTTALLFKRWQHGAPLLCQVVLPRSYFGMSLPNRAVEWKPQPICCEVAGDAKMLKKCDEKWQFRPVECREMFRQKSCSIASSAKS